jgi:predicted metal-binding membrane protein
MDSELETTRPGPAPERVFFGISALLFLSSVAATVYWARSMPGGMSMDSTIWSLMPGQTWPAAAAAFLLTWTVMMAAMMLPSLAAMLAGYRRTLRQTGQLRLAGITAGAGASYFLVWALFCAVIYPIGAALSAAEMQSPDLARLAPVGTGAALLLAGAFQLTGWKAGQLERCHAVPGALSPWRYGFSLGLHCCLCCLGFMLALLVNGVMNLGVMAVVAAAITIERLAPRPRPVTLALGATLLLAGLALIVQSLGLA